MYAGVYDPYRAFAYFNNNYALKRGTVGQNGGMHYLFECPFCFKRYGDKKAFVNVELGYVKCWRGCFSGGVFQFIMDTENVSYIRAKEIIHNTKPEKFSIETINEIVVDKKMRGIELPYSYKSLLYGNGSMAKRARRYLSERGFNLEQLDQQGIGYCDERYRAKADENDKDAYRKDYYGRIIIPFKQHGKLVYYIGRTVIGDELRYKNPPTDEVGVGKSELLFNSDALNIYDTVHILEGAFDAMTLGQDAVSIQGWNLSKEQKAIIVRSGCKHLIFVPDKKFYREAVKTAMQFIDLKKVSVVNLDNVLPDEPDLKDVNSIGKELVVEEIKNTPLLTYGLAMEAVME